MLSVSAAAIWVLLACGVAALPMRWQIAPGLALLIAAPVLIVLLGRDHGAIAAGFGVFALLSMFRRPILHALGRLRQRHGAEARK